MPAPGEIGALFGLRRGEPNIADKSNPTSLTIARNMFDQMRIRRQDDCSSQAIGREFEKAVEKFLVRELPGSLNGRRLNVNSQQASAFDQYAHLDQIGKLIEGDREGTLRATIGIDYRVKPDVTVSLSRAGADAAFLHAAVQCKWTLRSDRAQNVRHDAVTLIRSRRGRVPHIVPVTAEPLPTRLASLARGTGEIDALYHVAMHELVSAVYASGGKKQIAALEELVGHGRLRDLSELPEVLLL